MNILIIGIPVFRIFMRGKYRHKYNVLFTNILCNIYNYRATFICI